MSETVNTEKIHTTILINLGGQDGRIVKISHSNKPGVFYWGYIDHGQVVRDITWDTPGKALDHMYKDSIPEWDPRDF